MAIALRMMLLGIAALSMAGCSEVNYERTKPGKLGGKLILEWIDQDKFRFISDTSDPLRFVRANNEVVRPGEMFTDGGSIPAPLRAIKSFSPWGYAPAFIIHDWLFVMKHCKLPGYEKWDHLKAAEVFSEVMKTVMENPRFGGPNKLVHYSMYEAVRSSIAKDYWDRGNCKTSGGILRSPTRSASKKPDPDQEKSADEAPAAPPRTRSTLPPAMPRTVSRMRTVVQY